MHIHQASLRILDATPPMAVFLSAAKDPRAKHSTTQSAFEMATRTSADADRLRRGTLRFAQSDGSKGECHSLCESVLRMTALEFGRLPQILHTTHMELLGGTA